MKALLSALVALLFAASVATAQESTSAFSFLSLPSSAHAVALGGRNISLIDDDPSLAAQNPALLSSVSNRTVGLNFMTYMQGSKVGGASYTQANGERGTWGLNMQMVGYGNIDETTDEGDIIGSLAAKDLALTGTYAYVLSPHWAAGVGAKLIYSRLASYSSFAMGIDLGLNYYSIDRDFTFSLTAANLGGQIVAFADEHESLPIRLDAGITKQLGHAPLRISLTFADIQYWDMKFMSHFDVGLDVLPTKNVWVALGYNCRRANEMKVAGSSRAAGLTAGAGLNIKRIKVGLAYAKYHISAPSIALSLAYTI